jgi:hypothetical protein
MKKLMLVGLSLLTNLIVAQQIKFEDVKNGGDIKGQYSSYLSSDGYEYKVGENIDFGLGSGMNGKFVIITSIDIAGNVLPVNSNAMNRSFEIKKIRVIGNKKQGLKVQFQTKGLTGVDNYFFILEDAIQVGEIKSKGMNSNQAMIELKKAKDKLDLGLITQEEYEKIKLELIKYIK